MLGMLGDLYLGQGKHDQAIYVYREMMRERPTSPQVCAWEHNVARAMLTIGAPADRVHEIEELVRLYSAIGSKLPKAEATECREDAAEMSGQLARMYHQEAAKTRNAELAGFAEPAVPRVPRRVPRREGHGETLYFSAELRWARAELAPHAGELGGPRRARSPSADRREARRRKLVQVAADAAMLGWMKALAVDPHVKEVPVDEAAYKTVPSRKPIPEREQRLLAAYDGYLTHVTDPKDSERIDVHVPQGEPPAPLRSLRRGDRDLPRHPREPSRPRGRGVLRAALLDGYNRLQRYDDMLAFAEVLAAELRGRSSRGAAGPSPGASPERAQGGRGAGGEARRPHDARRRSSRARTATCGVQPRLDAPDADELLYNAGVCYEEGRSIGAAKAMYEKLGKLFPKSKLTAQSSRGSATSTRRPRTIARRPRSSRSTPRSTPASRTRTTRSPMRCVFRKGLGDDARRSRHADVHPHVRHDEARRGRERVWALVAIYEKQDDARCG